MTEWELKERAEKIRARYNKPGIEFLKKPGKNSPCPFCGGTGVVKATECEEK